jgi:tRNA (guanine-N7-)-methyltransferase
MGKDKLRRFALMKEFPHVVEAFYNTPFPLKGNWNRRFFGKEAPIVLELGCGKGEYSIGLASHSVDKHFIGVDIKGARMFIGASQALSAGMQNVAFLRARIDIIEQCFSEGEVDEIWLTFSDPQPNKPNKRLTSPLFLNRYRKILKPGGLIHLKTDSDVLYESTMEVLVSMGIIPDFHTNDLYRQMDLVQNPFLREILQIETHYEKLFRARGHVIKYCSFRVS